MSHKYAMEIIKCTIRDMKKTRRVFSVLRYSSSSYVYKSTRRNGFVWRSVSGH